MKKRRIISHRVISLSAVFLLLFVVLVSRDPYAGAIPNTLPNRYAQLSNSTVGAPSVQFILGFDILTPGVLGSIEIEFCDNDPFPGEFCDSVNGADVSAVTLIGQSGTNDLSIDTVNSTASRIVLTRTPSAVGLITFQFTFSGMTNPTTAGTHYVRLRTFVSDDASGTQTDKGGIATAITNAINVTTEVPPILDFCVAILITSDDCSATEGSNIDLGTFSATNVASATSQFVVGTNAPNGYSVSFTGTTLTAGNEIITANQVQAPSQPGTGQFGFNLRQNALPPIGSEPTGSGVAFATAEYNDPDLYKFRSGDTLVTYNDAENYRKFTVSYIANVSRDQKPGVYVTTLTYICLGNF